MEIKSYKELIAYTKGRELVKAVYEMTRKFPKEEMYGITSQIRRSSISIPSNIAEGYMRGSKEYPSKSAIVSQNRKRGLLEVLS